MKIKIDKKDIFTYTKNILLIILGTAILAFGTAIFLVPYELVTGGVSGLAIVFESFLGDNFGIFLGEDFYITVLTWVLFFLGLIFLGKDFAAKTLLSSIFYPIFYVAFSALVDPKVNAINGYFMLQNSQYEDIAVLLAAVIGGAAVGAGCAVTFIAGGSTGGVDVLSFLLCKVFKRLKSSHVIFAIDAAIVVLGVFIIDDIVLSLLGIISAFICAAVIDRIFLGSTDAYVAQIVTNHSDAISQRIIKELDRTATIIDSVGAYSGKPKKLVFVSFNMREYSQLMNIINSEDPTAFMTISKVHENHGEGWTTDKT